MASQKILAKKKKLVKELADELKEAQSIVFTDYQGLTVAQDTEMRAAFRKEGVEYRVIKNNISRRALESLGIVPEGDELIGPTALAFSKDDIVIAPRLAKKYVDEFKKIKIKGGVVEGKLESLDLINQLASIPSQETLYGQLVSSLLFPITSLAMTLGAAAKACEEKGLEQVKDLVNEDAASAKAEEPAADAEATEAQAEAANEASEEDAPAPAEAPAE
ncbi:MAG: 50S ribosomal protein L10 [Eubacteriales bacterium]|nr:50S ribosomal protein L10 [Eubacteriales bacterium]